MKISKRMIILFFCLSLVISVYTIIDTNNDIKNEEQITADLYRRKLDNVLQEAIQTTKALETIIEYQKGDFEIDFFYEITSNLDNVNLNEIYMYVNDAHIKYVYPIEYQDNSFNTDGFNIDLIDEYISFTKESNELLIMGPFELYENYFAFIVASPIFINDQYKGFTAATIEFNSILDYVGINTLNSLGYDFELETKFQNEEIIAVRTIGFNADMAQISKSYLYDYEINFKVHDDNRVYKLLTHTLFSFFSVNAVGLFIYIVFKNHEKKQKIMKYNLTHDRLTRALNRRGLLEKIKKFDNYYLYFIDLNDFKPVNDNYGHEVGDKLLVAFTNRIKANFKKNNIIARFGGDEFIVIVDNINDDIAENIKIRIKDLTCKTFIIDGLHINISASIGYSSTNDSDNIDELISIADKKMYEEKSRKHK